MEIDLEPLLRALLAPSALTADNAYRRYLAGNDVGHTAYAFLAEPQTANER